MSDKRIFVQVAYDNEAEFLGTFWHESKHQKGSSLINVSIFDGRLDFSVQVTDEETTYLHSVPLSAYNAWCDTMKLVNWVNKK